MGRWDLSYSCHSQWFMELTLKDAFCVSLWFWQLLPSIAFDTSGVRTGSEKAKHTESPSVTANSFLAAPREKVTTDRLNRVGRIEWLLGSVCNQAGYTAGLLSPQEERISFRGSTSVRIWAGHKSSETITLPSAAAEEVWGDSINATSRVFSLAVSWFCIGWSDQPNVSPKKKESKKKKQVNSICKSETELKQKVSVCRSHFMVWISTHSHAHTLIQFIRVDAHTAISAHSMFCAARWMIVSLIDTLFHWCQSLEDCLLELINNL